MKGKITGRRELSFLGAAALSFALGFLTKPGAPLQIDGFGAASDILFVLAYLLAGRDVLLGAARNILRGRVFDELFLMSVATLGAIVIGRYEEAVGVMAFYKVGEALQESASERSRSSVSALLALRPSQARLRRGGDWALVDPNEARAGDEFMVLPGERVPLDGEVVEGECFVDSSTLTGESLPRRVEPGMEILAGCVAVDEREVGIGGPSQPRAVRGGARLVGELQSLEQRIARHAPHAPVGGEQIER